MKDAVGNLVWLDRSLFDRRASQEEAEAFCRDLARTHYENFTVASFLLPRALRQHFSNIYAFCRVSDDLADEIADPREALDRLEEWRDNLDRCYRGESLHPVFVALEKTVRQFDIPREPFENLLAAFRQDQVQTRYETWKDLIGYCRNSANPVGHLVLHLCGYRDEARRQMSDNTCTALQLVNFWQDVDRDFAKGRIYIPREILQRHGYTEEMLARRVLNAEWISMMKELIGRTRPMFHEGLALCRIVHPRVRLDIELFSRGGLEILRTIEAIGYDTLRRRPHLTRRREFLLVMQAILRTLVPSQSAEPGGTA